MLETMPRLMTIEEVARTLAVSVRTVERLGRDGDLRIVYVGRLRRVPQTDVETFIAEATGDGPEAE